MFRGVASPSGSRPKILPCLALAREGKIFRKREGKFIPPQQRELVSDDSGARDGNRTRVSCLGSKRTTTVLLSLGKKTIQNFLPEFFLFFLFFDFFLFRWQDYDDLLAWLLISLLIQLFFPILLFLNLRQSSL
jgi:hypothetical protein